MRRPEDTRYSFGTDGHKLTIYRDAIDQSAIDTFRAASVELGLSAYEPLLVLSYRFCPTGFDGYAVFDWRLIATVGQGLPVIDDSSRHEVLRLVLVGSDDEIVYATRKIHLTPDFGRSLEAAIHDQVARPFDAVASIRSVLALQIDILAKSQPERVISSMVDCSG